MAVKFSLVIPTYNEAANIASLLGELLETLTKLSIQFEVIIVDDDSPDGTWKIAEGLAKDEKRIKVIRRRGERGLATAVVRGWAAAEGEILGVMDADLQHPPEVLVKMLDKIINDREVDIVVASRYVEGGGVSGWNFWRRRISSFAIFLSRVFIPRASNLVKDPMSGYFIMHSSVIADKLLEPIGYKILLEVLVKGEYRNVLEVPYVFEERTMGKSRVGIRLYFISLLHLIKLRRYYKNKKMVPAVLL